MTNKSKKTSSGEAEGDFPFLDPLLGDGGLTLILGSSSSGPAVVTPFFSQRGLLSIEKKRLRCFGLATAIDFEGARRYVFGWVQSADIDSGNLA
jgi:hypothetical protein